MGIYKRGNIYWIRYADADGKVQWESSGSRYHKDAKDKLTERQNEAKEIREGKRTPEQRIGDHTFNELAEHYIV